jgi:beta-N-acetylglucosaminidase
LTVTSDLRILSNLTADDYNKMLSGTALKGLGGALAQAEKESGVNGLYLMGLACLESGYGTSNFARNRNNLVGWNAVDSDPKKATYFKSKDECIIFVAERLKKNYLSENGCYFKGYSARDVDKKYCTDKKHADKIVNIVNKLKNKI